MKGFKNANVYVEGKGIVKCDLAFDTRIEKIGNVELDEIINIPNNCIVLPGFIDQHIHGAGGSDAMDGTSQALENVANYVAKEGTVAFLATTMTQSPKNIIKALSAVKEYDGELGAEILGVHLEGPFISKKHVGAQPLEYVVNPDVNTFKKYNEISGDKIRLVTLAPEENGGIDLVDYLSSNNIVPSVGHSDAGYNVLSVAVANGLRNVTHLYNAQKGLHHRDIGVVGTALYNDNLFTEIIADTIHLSVPALKFVVKNKPKDRVVLITDAMRAKGLADGISELGGQKVIVSNGEARLENGALAGSVLRMNEAVRNMVVKVGVDLGDAVDMASKNPALNLGIYNDYGSISEGKYASFTVLDQDFNVLMTIKKGRIIFNSLDI